MSAWDGIFGANSIGEQILFYNIGQSVATTLLGPFLQQISNAINKAHPEVPLSPAVLADMVVRNIIDASTGESVASQSGINNQDFANLVLETGEPPAPQQLIELWLRGIIPETSGPIPEVSVDNGLREGRLRDEWITAIKGLAQQRVDMSTLVNGYVESQIDSDTYYAGMAEWGIDQEKALIYFNTRGNPPSLSELIELYRRGIIPMKGSGPEALSFEQGIYEGASRDKWESQFEALTVAIPPPRTVSALEGAGVLSQAQAQQYYQMAGLDATLSAAYAQSAFAVKFAAERTIVKTQILDLYELGALPAAEAEAGLLPLGYSQQDAGFLIQIADLKRELAQLNAAITKLRGLYIEHKLQKETVLTGLQELGVPPSQITAMFSIWDQEIQATVRTLSPADIGDAVKYQVIDPSEGMSLMQNLGYTAHDAWVYLGAYNLGALTIPEPAQTTVLGSEPLA